MRQEYEAMKILPKITVKELVSNNALRIPLIIALVMMIAQQLSGINAVIFYSTDIFKGAGLTLQAATYATLAIGGVNVLMTIVSVILVEKAGRKTLLLVGFGGMVIDTFLLTIALQFSVSLNQIKKILYYYQHTKFCFRNILLLPNICAYSWWSCSLYCLLPAPVRFHGSWYRSCSANRRDPQRHLLLYLSTGLPISWLQ